MSATELAQALRKLADILEDNTPAVPTESQLDRILREVCVAHSITEDELVGMSRARHLHAARVEAYRRIRTELGWSYPVIAKHFGRNHSSIMSALEA